MIIMLIATFFLYGLQPATCCAADNRSHNILSQRDIFPRPSLSQQDPDLPAIMAPSDGKRYTTQAELDQITNRATSDSGVKSGATQEKPT